MAITIEQMYEEYSVLADAGPEASKHIKAYQNLLLGVKGEEGARQLAAQFIPKFFQYFSSLGDQAMDALIDLCEEESFAIRLPAIKGLPEICKHAPTLVTKVANVLTQLLQTDDVKESKAAQNALLELFEIDANDSLSGIFNQVIAGDDSTRAKAIHFLKEDIIGNNKKYIKDDETLDTFVKYVKNTLQDVTGEEFQTFVEMFQTLPAFQTKRAQELFNIVSDQLSSEAVFKPTESEHCEKVSGCLDMAEKCYKVGINATCLVSYVINNVLPCFDKVLEKYQVDILKPFASIISQCTLIDVDAFVPILHDCVMSLIPSIPEVVDEKDETEFKLTELECLLFSFYTLLKQSPTFWTSTESIAESKKKLNYLARKCLTISNKLDQAATSLTVQNQQTKEAIRTSQNITLIIRDLFKPQPGFSTKIKLSWVEIPVNQPATSNGQKSNVSGKKPSQQLFQAKNTKRTSSPALQKTNHKNTFTPKATPKTLTNNKGFPKATGVTKRAAGEQGGVAKKWAGTYVPPRGDFSSQLSTTGNASSSKKKINQTMRNNNSRGRGRGKRNWNKRY